MVLYKLLIIKKDPHCQESSHTPHHHLNVKQDITEDTLKGSAVTRNHEGTDEKQPGAFHLERVGSPPTQSRTVPPDSAQPSPLTFPPQSSYAPIVC